MLAEEKIGTHDRLRSKQGFECFTINVS